MHVLFIGQQPETVDFSDPALPPGFNAEKIHAGIKLAMDDMVARGWEAVFCSVKPDETAAPQVESALTAKNYNCVAVGAGIRMPPKSLALFERVIDAVHSAAPDAMIAFNTKPEDTADAVDRVMSDVTAKPQA